MEKGGYFQRTGTMGSIKALKLALLLKLTLEFSANFHFLETSLVIKWTIINDVTHKIVISIMLWQ